MRSLIYDWLINFYYIYLSSIFNTFVTIVFTLFARARTKLGFIHDRFNGFPDFSLEFVGKLGSRHG